jgi:hypothetical protein
MQSESRQTGQNGDIRLPPKPYYADSSQAPDAQPQGHASPLSSEESPLGTSNTNKPESKSSPLFIDSSDDDRYRLNESLPDNVVIGDLLPLDDEAGSFNLSGSDREAERTEADTRGINGTILDSLDSKAAQ